MKIRPYREDDREAICEIAVSVFSEVSVDAAIERDFGKLHLTDWRDRKRRDIESDLDANPQGCFVAEVDGRVVGFITTRVDREASVGRIPNLAVAESFQGQHIGRRLLTHALDYFEAEGLQFTQIETLTTNRRGMQFYPSVGYREVARKIYYFMRLAERKDR